MTYNINPLVYIFLRQGLAKRGPSFFSFSEHCLARMHFHLAAPRFLVRMAPPVTFKSDLEGAGLCRDSQSDRGRSVGSVHLRDQRRGRNLGATPLLVGPRKRPAVGRTAVRDRDVSAPRRPPCVRNCKLL